jgi:hypothetical protein
MTGFSITSAALTGFRIVRERPKAVLVWALGSLVANFVLMYALGPLLAKLRNLPSDVLQDPAKLSALLAPHGDAIGLVIVVSLAINAILNAAMNRAVLRPTDHGFGYVRVGLDEARQLGLILLVLVIAYLISLPASILIALSGASRDAATVTVIIGGIGLWIYLGARISLASALTFDRNRIDIVAAWRLSRGHVWPMLAVYALSLLMSLIVFLLTLAVVNAGTAVAAGGLTGLARIEDTIPLTLAAYLEPGRIVYLVLNSLATALVWPIWMTPPAEIYLRLKDGPAD